MTKKVLKRTFHERATVPVAKELLGKFLVVRHGSEIQARMITEVEAYVGPGDKACHARHGKTARNFPMFGPGGYWYVYLCMGLFWMLNIVTERSGCAEAVLIRGVEGASGPGRVTRLLKIDKTFQARPATVKTGLWIEDRGIAVPAASIRHGPRVGINYAGPYWARRHLRFWLDDPRRFDPQTEVNPDGDCKRKSRNRRSAEAL